MAAAKKHKDFNFLLFPSSSSIMNNYKGNHQSFPKSNSHFLSLSLTVADHVILLHLNRTNYPRRTLSSGSILLTECSSPVLLRVGWFLFLISDLEVNSVWQDKGGQTLLITDVVWSFTICIFVRVGLIAACSMMILRNLVDLIFRPEPDSCLPTKEYNEANK